MIRNLFCRKCEYLIASKYATCINSFAEEFKWIEKYTPKFIVNANNVNILSKPVDYYKLFQNETKKSHRRINISSLYIGTGDLETKLIKSIEDKLNTNNHIKVSILVDYTRSTRGKISTCTLLQKLSDFAEIYLFHTPDLRGILKKILPEKFNEVIGVCHMKFAVFDDNIIISGANLSENYFCNRQDRYIFIKDSPKLADFLSDFLQIVHTFSFKLLPDMSLNYNEDQQHHPFNESIDFGANNFKTLFYERIQTFLNDRIKDMLIENEYDYSNSAIIYPLIQMNSCGIIMDSEITIRLIKDAACLSILHLSSGYFNLTPDYEKAILKNKNCKFIILTASPEANGFFEASGLASGITHAYTLLLKNFFNNINDKKQIQIYEYYKPNWTFHAKGLWLYFNNEEYPSLTLIGSPNFGYRSTYRDFELQFVIVTDNLDLRKKFHKERIDLYSLSKSVNEETFLNDDRKIPLWVQFFTKSIKHFF